MVDFFGELQEEVGTTTKPTATLFDEIQQEGLERRELGPKAGRQPTERERRSQALAEQVGQEILGAPGLGSTEGIERARDLAVRADISLSTLFEEKRAKFMSAFPDGDFVSVKEPTNPDKQVVLFRKSGQDEFSELDPIAIDRFEILGDLADFMGEVPSLTGEAAAIIVSRGAGFVRQALQIAAGNVVGELAKEGVEELRNFQKETFSQVLKRSAVQGGFALTGAVASTAFTGPLNFLRRGFSPTARGAEATVAAEALEIPPLTVSQIAKSPLVQKMGGQSAAIVSTIGDYIRRQQEAAVLALSQLRNRELAPFLRGELNRLHDEASKQIIAAAKVLPGLNQKGGEALKAGVAEFDNFARLMVDSAYRRARKIEEPVFDLVQQKDAASLVKSITEGVGAKGEGVTKLADDIIAFDGQPRTVVLEGSGEEATVSVTDQLLNLRQRARDLAEPPLGQRRAVEHAQAKRLEGVLTRTLKNPTNESTEFLESWARANDLARKRFETRDKLAVIDVAKTETPAGLVPSLAKPNKIDDLVNIREAVPEARWNEFREAVKADFIAPENVNSLTKRLDSFDKPTLDVLLRPADQKVLKNIGFQIDRLNDVGIKQALNRQSRFGAQVDELVNTNDTAGIDLLATLAPDGSLAHRAIRAGMMENIIKRVVRPNEAGERIVQPSLLLAEVEKLQSTGAWRFLNKQDREVLRNLEKIVPFLPERSDTGASLMAGAAVSGARSLTLDAILTIVENIGVGRFLTTPGFNRFVNRLSQADLSFAGDIIRVVGATLTDAATEFTRERDAIQQGREGTGLTETQDLLFGVP